MPEEVRVVETISEDGKPKKRKIRTRIIKKVRGDKKEVTKIEIVEEDDKQPETTVTVEETPVEEVPEELEKCPKRCVWLNPSPKTVNQRRRRYALV
nr:titin-like [Bactrocera oleae]